MPCRSARCLSEVVDGTLHEKTQKKKGEHRLHDARPGNQP